jgi:AcrR family transcriptional regulator
VPPPTPSDPVELRREQILRAALDVIVERGYPDTRIADVAAAAGLSPALVLYYFRTKERLLTEAMAYAEDRWYREGERRMARCPSALGKLVELVSMTCEPDGDPSGESWAVWLDLWAAAARNPRLGTVREEFDARWRETIRRVVEEGVRRGEFETADPDRAALALSALLDGLAIQIALGDPVATPAVARDVALEAACALLGCPLAAARAADVDPDPAPSVSRRRRRRATSS